MESNQTANTKPEPARTPSADAGAAAAVSAPAVSGDKAFELLLPEFRALPEDELRQINVDVPSAVTTVIGSLPQILEFADEIAAKSPELTRPRLERLRTCALALNYAHARYLSAAPPQNNLDKLLAEATERLEVLSADTAPLGRRGIINPRELQDVGKPVGYKNVAVALTRFVTVLKENWERIQGMCAVKLEELDSALRVAELILDAVGIKEQGVTHIESATEDRMRAYTFFWNEYDLVRQALGFIRWRQGDADDIAPPIFSGGGQKRRPGDKPVDAPQVAPAGNAPAANVPAEPANPNSPARQAAPTNEKENPDRDPFLNNR